MDCGRPWGQIDWSFHLLVVSLMVLTSPANAEIIVVDIDTNETSPIFQDLTAAFGPNFPHNGLMGRIAYSSPPDACSPVQPPPFPREDHIGWVLVIARGGHCGFADKVLAAQHKGYDAVIVHNYEGHESLVKMYGNENGSFVNIPSTFVGWQEGMRLKNEYNYTYRKYYVKIIEEEDINFKLYLWPFVVVVSVCFLIVMIFVIVKFVKEHAKRRLNRLSRKHLKKIPVRKYKKGDYYDTCAICLDEYEEGEKLRVLPCDHVYHTKCIDPWLTKNKKTCPVCKRRVMPGGDASDSDSDNDGNINSSERTPLLTESSGSTGPGRTVPQYTTTTTPSLHAPGNEEGSLPTTSSHSPPLSCSQQSASAHISTDGCGQVFLSQARHGRSGERTANEPMSIDFDENQGAVGGAGISDQIFVASSEADLLPQLRQDAGHKRKRPEWRRAGVWEEEDYRPIETLSVHLAETREERRERRKRKKERKRRAEELARRAVETEANEATSNNGGGISQRVSVEPVEDVPTLPIPSEQVFPRRSGSIEGALGEEVNNDGNHESYINPSYSESEELVLHNPGRRHEMNDMV